jgi:hypothetical protein
MNGPAVHTHIGRAAGPGGRLGGLGVGGVLSLCFFLRVRDTALVLCFFLRIRGEFAETLFPSSRRFVGDMRAFHTQPTR